MRDHWRRNGPPVNIALVAIAASLGIDLTGGGGEAAIPTVEEAAAGPSIAELAQMMAVPAGHDTRVASRLIAARWKEGRDGDD